MSEAVIVDPPVLRSLESLGWRVDRLRERKPIPADILARYPRLPASYRELIESVKLVTSPDETAWLVTSSAMAAETEAYAWNEWEKQSLEAASDDTNLTAAIRAFWDRNVPVMMSVKSGYAYLALDTETMAVVRGEEPEYEEATPLAASLEDLWLLVEAKSGERRVEALEQHHAADEEGASDRRRPRGRPREGSTRRSRGQSSARRPADDRLPLSRQPARE